MEYGGFEDPARPGEALVKGLAFWRPRSKVAADLLVSEKRLGSGNLCDVQGVACSRFDVGCCLDADGCAGPMDAGCHDPGDHLGAQWSGLFVGRLVDRPTHHPFKGRCRSAAASRVFWSPMADGLRLGFSDDFAQLRGV